MPNKKIKLHIDKAITELKNDTKEPSFDINYFNFEKAKRDIGQSYDALIFSKRDFADVANNTEIREILKKLGMPNKIDEEFVAVRMPFIGNVITQRLILKYDQLGNIRLGYDNDKLVVERIHQAIDISPAMAESENGKQITAILSGTPLEYREAAQVVYAEKRYTEEVLDAAAKRIWMDKNNEDDYAIDGVAWLLKCIMASGNARYSHLLKEVIAQSKISKIKRYAKDAQKSILVADVEQFMP